MSPQNLPFVLAAFKTTTFLPPTHHLSLFSTPPTFLRSNSVPSTIAATAQHDRRHGRCLVPMATAMSRSFILTCVHSLMPELLFMAIAGLLFCSSAATYLDGQ